MRAAGYVLGGPLVATSVKRPAVVRSANLTPLSACEAMNAR
jgi:hypothetical protein